MTILFAFFTSIYNNNLEEKVKNTNFEAKVPILD